MQGWNFQKIQRFLVGGKFRQDTVRIALNWVETEWVLIHDASRPVVYASDVENLLACVSHSDGATLAVPPRYTLAHFSHNRIIQAVDRSSLLELHTPQIFRTALLREAHRKAQEEGKVFTDDATLLSYYGGRIVYVEPTGFPFKITYPGDEVITQCLLENIG